MQNEVVNAIDIVDHLSDVQAVSLIKHIGRNLTGKENMEKVRIVEFGDADLESLKTLTLEMKKENLDSESSKASARLILRAMAESPELSPVVIDSWEEIKNDDKLVVETIIALGLIANLTILLSTTKVKLKYKGLEIDKGEASVPLIRAILNPILAFIHKRN